LPPAPSSPLVPYTTLFRSRSTTRLRDHVVSAVITSGRAASEVARAHGVSWWLVQAALAAAAVVLPTVDDVRVTRLGVDEHRYRSDRKSTRLNSSHVSISYA